MDNGANVKATNKDFNTPLHYLVRHSPGARQLVQFEETLDYMIERGAFINARNAHGETPLHQAVLRGSPQLFVLLVNRGADYKMTNKYGETVLHYAVMALKRRVVEMLLDLGVDPCGGTGVSGTELDAARNAGPAGKEIYDLLLSKVKDLSTIGSQGSTDTSRSSISTVGSNSGATATTSGASSPSAAAGGGSTSASSAVDDQDLKIKMLKKTHHWQIDYNEL